MITDMEAYKIGESAREVDCQKSDHRQKSRLLLDASDMKEI